MTTDAIADALLLASVAANAGDAPTAQAHLADARGTARRTARRDRQLVEIAALVVAGHGARAAGLAVEHAAAFPEDADLLARIADVTPP
jgi:hypothetical protein